MSQQLTVQQALELAIQHQDAGRLKDAESIYHQILKVDPANAEALHWLGVLYGQAGRPDLAVDLVGRAIDSFRAILNFS